MTTTATPAAGEAVPSALMARRAARAEAITLDQKRLALWRKTLTKKTLQTKKTLESKPEPRRLSDKRWRETLIEEITRALAEHRVVFTTTPGAIATATGLQPRVIGLVCARYRAELDVACAAAGVTVVDYKMKDAYRKAARLEFTLDAAPERGA